MLTSLRVLILSLCVIGFSCKGLAVTTLVIATGEHPPYVSENQKESFMTEVLHEVAHEMGVRFEFRFMPWKRCELAVEKLEAWGAIPYVITPEREKKFDFSERLYNKQSKFFFYSRSGTYKQIPYADLSDLKGYRIGGVRGYYYEQAFLEAGLDVEYVTAEELNFRKLQAGRVDLIPAEVVLGFHIIRKLFPLEVGNFFTLSKPLDASGNYLMTSKQYPDSQNLLTKFNVALKKIKGNGVYQRILDKHAVVLTY
ncbi:MAG: substrate-binding periplasmic protein [Syntrophobacteraceae bacterium]